MPHAPETRPIVLLTGVTGYIGGRLLPALVARGDLAVRCMVRRAAQVAGRVPGDVELAEADALDPEATRAAMEGVETAYYLIHALGSGGAFAAEEQEAARHFARAAEAAGVRRIIYLGGLGNDPSVSPHLASRRAVGEIFRDSNVPTVEFRASLVVGSGSLSFELVRALTEKLPLMVVPKWGRALTQPIAIEDVLAYLEAALDLAPGPSRLYEIGGPDRVSYVDLMKAYARQRGLRRLMVPVPVLTPRLSSLWLTLVTPVYARVGRKLIDSCATPTVVQDEAALQDFDIRPRGYRAAIERALAREDEQFARTRWSDARSSVPGPPHTAGSRRYGSRIIDTRVMEIAAPPAAAFTPIRRIGGEVGWYSATDVQPPSSPERQAAFIRHLPELLGGFDVHAVCWMSLMDLKRVPALKALEESLPQFFSLALLDENLEPKPAWRAWQALREHTAATTTETPV